MLGKTIITLVLAAGLGIVAIGTSALTGTNSEDSSSTDLACCDAVQTSACCAEGAVCCENNEECCVAGSCCDAAQKPACCVEGVDCCAEGADCCENLEVGAEKIH